MDAFDAVVLELIVRHGVKASEFHNHLRDMVKKASGNLPPVQVLYCIPNSHKEWSPGRFRIRNSRRKDKFRSRCYNPTFMRFIEARQNIPESLTTICAMQGVSDSDRLDRVRHVQWIAPFGRHIAKKWPQIAKLAKAYMRNNLGQRMDEIQEIAMYEKRLMEIPKTIDKILNERGRSDGKTKWSLSDLREDADYSMYTPATLWDICKKLDTTRWDLSLLRKKKLAKLRVHMTEAQYEAMSSCKTKFAEEVCEPTGPTDIYPWNTGALTYPGFFPWGWVPSFIEAIEHYGEEQYTVWLRQSYFNVNAIRFLLLHPERTERLAAEGNTNVDYEQQLGLCAASSPEWELRIAKVPCMAEWTVAVERNGKERIDLV